MGAIRDAKGATQERASVRILSLSLDWARR